MAPNIAILGLTGDPPHLGHFEVAQMVRGMGYDQVWLMPTRQNPLKGHKPVGAFHRLQLTELLAREDSDWLKVSTFELGLTYAEINVRTHKVLHGLKTVLAEPNLTFVMGADNMVDLHAWEHWEDILRDVGLLVLPREPWTARVDTCPAAKALANRRDTGHGVVPTGMWRLAEEGILHPASSTDIRAQLLRGEASEHLTEDQNAYIRENGLYGFGQT